MRLTDQILTFLNGSPGMKYTIAEINDGLHREDTKSQRDGVNNNALKLTRKSLIRRERAPHQSGMTQAPYQYWIPPKDTP